MKKLYGFGIFFVFMCGFFGITVAQSSSGDAEIEAFANELIQLIQQAVDEQDATVSASSSVEDLFVFDQTAMKLRLTDSQFVQRVAGGIILADTQQAVDYLFNQWLTKYNTETSFMANNSLRRDEAAAFFSRLANFVMGKLPDVNKAGCTTFSDLDEGHTDLKAVMIQSCQLGLFKGTQGAFLPTKSLTNAEAIAVLVRLINGYESEQTDGHRAKNYFLLAQKMGVLKWLAGNDSTKLDKPITRWDVAKMLETARLIIFIKSKLGVDDANKLISSFTAIESSFQK